ncbi:MAG TPA: TlpA disulfide reductase family protein [Ferruginibacter sp.]|nr:TlpA disulfide reductase family protein [Ferruginibacter sp.]
MQRFLQDNEKLKIPDTVKWQNLYRELKSFIIKHPKNENNFLFIFEGVNLTYKQVDTLVKLVDSSMNSSPQKAFADVLLKRLSVVETGKPFPALTLVDTLGQELSISDLKGKIVFIDVWSSWCGPCREQIPDLKKLYSKYHTKGFEVIGMSVDDNKEKWLKAIEKDKQTWKHYCEFRNWRYNKFAMRFSVFVIPANFLIDQNGILVGQDLSPEALSSWLAQNHL